MCRPCLPQTFYTKYVQKLLYLDMLKQLFSSLLLLVLFSCGDNTEYRYRAKPIKLKVKDIYRADIVKNAMFDAEEMDVAALKRSSKNEFLKGVDAFKNKKDIGTAIKQFKKAILLFPDAKLYYELGNALLKRGGVVSLEEAEDAYRVANTLGFQPQNLLVFKEAMVNYQLYKTTTTAYKNNYLNEALYQLKKAMISGFIDSVAVGKEPLLSGIEQDFQYKYLLLTLKPIEGANAGENKPFNMYKSLFPNHTNGLKITPDQVEMKSYRESISYDFAKFIPEMESSSFSRDVTADYYYVGKVKETPFYTALLYASVSFSEQDMQPVYTQLVVYDNNTGNVISSKTVACNCSPEKIRVANISADKIEIEDLTRIWDKPVTAVSFDQNRVVDYKSEGHATYTISELGTIEVQDRSKQFSDSLLIVGK